MADTSSKKTNYISRVRQGVDAILAEIAGLEALMQEGQVLGYVAPLNANGQPQPGSLTDADFVGDNSFLSAADFTKIAGALQGLDAQLHGNNAATLQSLFLARR